MDIEGTFNHASKGDIRSTLTTFVVPMILVDWISHMLGNRFLEATKGVSPRLSVNRDKTVVVVFTRRYKWDASYPL